MKITSRRCCVLPLLCLALAIAVPKAEAAFDMFLKLDGIDGESVDTQHPKEIVVTSFSQGISNPSAVPGGSAGRSVFSGLTLSKPLDKSTPLLMQNSAAGTTIKSAVLTVRRPDRQEVYKVTLNDVVISNVATGGSNGDSAPVDTLTLTFTHIEWRYTPYDGSGRPGTQVTGSWDLLAGNP